MNIQGTERNCTFAFLFFFSPPRIAFLLTSVAQKAQFHWKNKIKKRNTNTYYIVILLYIFLQLNRYFLNTYIVAFSLLQSRYCIYFVVTLLHLHHYILIIARLRICFREIFKHINTFVTKFSEWNKSLRKFHLFGCASKNINFYKYPHICTAVFGALYLYNNIALALIALHFYCCNYIIAYISLNFYDFTCTTARVLLKVHYRACTRELL